MLTFFGITTLKPSKFLGSKFLKDIQFWGIASLLCMVAELGPGAFAELNFQSDLVSKLDAVKQNGYAVDPQ